MLPTCSVPMPKPSCVKYAKFNNQNAQVTPFSLGSMPSPGKHKGNELCLSTSKVFMGWSGEMAENVKTLKRYKCRQDIVILYHLQWQQGSWAKGGVLKGDSHQYGWRFRAITVFSRTVLFPVSLRRPGNGCPNRGDDPAAVRRGHVLCVEMCVADRPDRLLLRLWCL